MEREVMRNVGKERKGTARSWEAGAWPCCLPGKGRYWVCPSGRQHLGFSPLRWPSSFACPRVEALGCFPLIVRSQRDHTLPPEWPLVPISWQAESGGGGEWSPWRPEAKPPDDCCFSPSGVSGRGGQCRPFGNPNNLLPPRPTAWLSDT